MQSQLASAQVGVQIKQNEAEARRAEGQGEAAYVELTGRAEATRVEAIGLAEAKAVEALGIARATGFEEQRQAIGEGPTAIVAVANAVAEGHITVVPEVLVTGGGGSLDGLAATLIRTFSNAGGRAQGGGNGERGDRRPPPTPTLDELEAESRAPADVVPAPAVVVDPEPGPAARE
jgi:uncharacterized membrane protein YqiK